MKNPHNLKVGDTLFHVPNHYYGREAPGAEVTITKVGRKWAHVGVGWGAGKVHIETLCVDGGGYSSPGRCYLSSGHYEAHMALDSAWRTFAERVNVHAKPSGVTEISQIERAAEILGIVLPTVERDGASK